MNLSERETAEACRTTIARLLLAAQLRVLDRRCAASPQPVPLPYEKRKPFAA